MNGRVAPALSATVLTCLSVRRARLPGVRRPTGQSLVRRPTPTAWTCSISVEVAPPDRIATTIEAAFAEEPLLTMKIFVYLRDSRGGKGERELHRIIMKIIMKKMASSEEMAPHLRINLPHLPTFGRY